LLPLGNAVLAQGQHGILVAHVWTLRSLWVETPDAFESAHSTTIATLQLVQPVQCPNVSERQATFLNRAKGLNGSRLRRAAPPTATDARREAPQIQFALKAQLVLHVALLRDGGVLCLRQLAPTQTRQYRVLTAPASTHPSFLVSLLVRVPILASHLDPARRTRTSLCPYVPAVRNNRQT
jgi:hypothetical protein